MLRALRELEVEGIHTTIPAHLALLDHPDFAAGNHSTKWVEDEVDPSLFAADRHRPHPRRPTAGDGAGAGRSSSGRCPVEVDGKRFAVKVWLPDAPVGGAGGRRGRRGERSRPKAAARRAAAATAPSPRRCRARSSRCSSPWATPSRRARRVLVLEAMKMENHINAETGGTVKEIRVAAGDTVGTGDVLVVIE